MTTTADLRDALRTYRGSEMTMKMPNMTRRSYRNWRPQVLPPRAQAIRDGAVGMRAKVGTREEVREDLSTIEQLIAERDDLQEQLRAFREATKYIEKPDEDLDHVTKLEERLTEVHAEIATYEATEREHNQEADKDRIRQQKAEEKARKAAQRRLPDSAKAAVKACNDLDKCGAESQDKLLQLVARYEQEVVADHQTKDALRCDFRDAGEVEVVNGYERLSDAAMGLMVRVEADAGRPQQREPLDPRDVGRVLRAVKLILAGHPGKRETVNGGKSKGAWLR